MRRVIPLKKARKKIRGYVNRFFRKNIFFIYILTNLSSVWSMSSNIPSSIWLNFTYVIARGRKPRFTSKKWRYIEQNKNIQAPPKRAPKRKTPEKHYF